MASGKALVGMTVTVIGMMMAVFMRPEITSSESGNCLLDRIRRVEDLNTMFISAVVLAGFGAGIAATSKGTKLGPQFKSMSYCLFCGLEKSLPYAACPRSGERFAS